jgi:hypothetical protein
MATAAAEHTAYALALLWQDMTPKQVVFDDVGWPTTLAVRQKSSQLTP